jgi:hypothetical protein
MHADADLAAERVKAAQAASKADERHVMLSYCWAQQEIILRVREALGSRNHRVWLDLEQMSGSTGQKTVLLVHLYKYDHFTKTGSGETQGKLQKKAVF